MFCYAQCNNGALLYELFCCIKSIKKTFDEQRVLPSFSCNVEAVLRNEEIYEADLLIDMGFSATAIADRVGHESIDITYNYAHLFPSKQAEMADKLNMERGN